MVTRLCAIKGNTRTGISLSISIWHRFQPRPMAKSRCIHPHLQKVCGSCGVNDFGNGSIMFFRKKQCVSTGKIIGYLRQFHLHYLQGIPVRQCPSTLDILLQHILKIRRKGWNEGRFNKVRLALLYPANIASRLLLTPSAFNASYCSFASSLLLPCDVILYKKL